MYVIEITTCFGLTCLTGHHQVKNFKEEVYKAYSIMYRSSIGIVTRSFTWYCMYCRHNPSGRTMALGSTQLLTEMSTRCIFWG